MLNTSANSTRVVLPQNAIWIGWNNARKESKTMLTVLSILLLILCHGACLEFLTISHKTTKANRVQLGIIRKILKKDLSKLLKQGFDHPPELRSSSKLWGNTGWELRMQLFTLSNSSEKRSTKGRSGLNGKVNLPKQSSERKRRRRKQNQAYLSLFPFWKHDQVVQPCKKVCDERSKRTWR